MPLDPIQAGCAITVGPTSTLAPEGVQTPMFTGGWYVPPGATFIVVHVTGLAGTADISTYFQPTGGALASLGPPQPLGPLSTATNQDPPTTGAPYFYWPVSAPAGGTAFANAAGHGGTGAVTVTADFGWCTNATGPYCPYGSEPISGTPFIVYLLPGLIDVALNELGLVWMAPLFTAFWFSTVNISTLCATLPPPMPSIDPHSFEAATATVKAALDNVLWQHFCKCSAGSPDPVRPPPPAPTEPPGWPTAPTFSCDDTSLCTLVGELTQAVAAISKTLLQDYQLDTLMQRQAVPFGYVHGAVHAGLHGAGDFAVADILGLEVNFTTLPPVTGHSAGDPDTYHQIGKVSLGTADGWRRSWMPTHNPYLIFPISGAFTRAGYTLPPGAVVTITELLREP